MPRTILKSLGLSNNEIKIYLTTLSLGQALISTISKKCGINRTSLYVIVEKLSKKGYLTYFIKNNVRYYSAVDPEVLFDKCKQNAHEAQNLMQKMEKMLPILNNLSSLTDKVKVRNYEGFEGVKTMLNDVIQDGKEVDALVQVESFPIDVVKYLKEEYFPKRAPQITDNCKTIILAKKKHKQYLNDILNFHPGQIKEVLPEKINIKVNIQVYNNKTAIYSINTNELNGVIIENEKLYETFKDIFNYLWLTL